MKESKNNINFNYFSMKRKLLLLLTVITGMVSSAWANDYTISTPEELLAFAAAVNEGETSANAVLTANIDLTGKTWTPIGNASNIYAGTFDGQGHAITNFSYTATTDYNGLFGFITSSAVVKNFSISGTLTSNGYTKNGVIGAVTGTPNISGIHSSLTINVSNFKAHSGGIVGGDDGATTTKMVVEGCEYSGKMTHSGAGDCQAGIVGYTGYGTIRNCIFSGEINGETNKYGGILGYCKQPSAGGVQNCLSIGKIVANDGCTTAAAIIANWNGGATSNVKNNYYCLKEGSTTTIAIGNKASSCEAPVLVTADKLASGEITYKLNGNKSENVAFYQTLKDDATPVLDAEHGVIYPAGRTHCDGTPYEGETGYSNAEPAQDDHNFADGFCTFCNALDKNYITTNGEGYYEIGTPVQLKWFAAYVNQVNANAKAVLTDNIDLDGVTWTPIGNSSAKYTGTFDGGGFTISGLNVTTTGNYSGFFGYVNTGAVIKNFTIEGDVNSSHQHVGGVVGCANGNVTISNVHSKVDIKCKSSRHAGILGSQQATGTINIDRCTYSGTLDGQNTSGNYGGFVGLSYSNDGAYIKITNCLFDGEIINVNADAGGFVGYTKNCKLTIKNCLSKGTVGAESPGQFIGTLNTPSNMTFAGVNYYVDGNVQGAGSGAPKSGSTTPKTATAAQLASGEVAYNLGQAFRQNIGTDAAPVLDATHAVVGKITAAGYATLYVADTDVEIPADVTAYAAEFENTWLKLNAISDAIAAGEPVVLKGDEGYYSFMPTTGAVKSSDNVLQGTAEEIDAAGKYVLAKPAEKAIGFYLAESGEIAAGKAYLEVSGSEVKGFTFAEDGETGIVSPLGETEEGVIYNLAGQRINKLQKGINIVNGKKVLK